MDTVTLLVIFGLVGIPSLMHLIMEHLTEHETDTRAKNGYPRL